MNASYYILRVAVKAVVLNSIFNDSIKSNLGFVQEQSSQESLAKIFVERSNSGKVVSLVRLLTSPKSHFLPRDGHIVIEKWFIDKIQLWI